MGTFTYDGTLRVDFDDRLLHHLQLVISTKLRRDESFIFTWTRPDADGGGRTSVWVDRTIPMSFDYPSNEIPTISRPWIEELNQSTYRMTGLQIVPDPGAVTAQPAKISA